MLKVQRCEHGESCEGCCWLWLGQTDSVKAYGKVSYDNRKYIAHSLIYSLRNNLDPRSNKRGSENRLHTCDTPLCCNWNHIYIGTHQHNADDKVSRDRQTKGETQPHAKLTASQVYQLRRLYHSGGWRKVELAALFHLSQSTVGKILAFEDWKHLKGELLIGRPPCITRYGAVYVLSK